MWVFHPVQLCISITAWVNWLNGGYLIPNLINVVIAAERNLEPRNAVKIKVNSLKLRNLKKQH
jgi:hypothetical protein